MNVMRWFFIAVCNTFPPLVGRVTAKMCYRFLSSYPEERGAFRTDVALCAIGLLRQGDIKGFERYVTLYPFSDRWLGFFHPGFFQIWCPTDYGWRIQSITGSPVRFGKAWIPPLKRKRK